MKLIDKVVATEVNHQIDKYLPSIEEKLEHLDKEGIIKHFVSTEFNRFLAFYKNAQDLNVSVNRKKGKNDRKDKENTKRGERTGHAEAGHIRFFINLGKEKNLQAHNLIGLINEYTRNRNIPIGKIDIMRKFSFFEVPTDFETDILSGLIDANWNGHRVNVEVSQAPGTKSSRASGRRRSRNGGSYSVQADRKKKNSVRDGRRSDSRGSSVKKNSKSASKRSSRVESSKGTSSFKKKFNAAAKRKRRN